MKRNKFKRALHHLNKKHVVESAPTNNTLGVFSVTPSGVGPVGWTDRTFTTDISGNPLPKDEVADFTVGESPANSTEAKDTTGLFEADGVTVKTLTPPGDNSYILGPFSSMWYAWGNFTTLGYIEEGTRKMRNLGTITGKLSDWDGSSINSYGQLTLEQALWFRDVKKFGDIDNDPANHNYRAFYPGPPSNVPDAFGRYRCVIAASREAGGEETRPGAPINNTQPGEMSADDNLSAILDHLTNRPKPSDFGSGKSGRAAYKRALRKWEERLAALEAASNDGPKLPDDPSGDPPTESNFFSKIKSNVKEGIKIVDKVLDYTEKVLSSFTKKLPQKSIADFISDTVMGANDGSSYNTQLAASLFNNVITGGNTKIKIGAEGRNNMVNSIDADALEKALVLGPAPEVNADNALRPGKKVEGVLKGRWGDQGGSEFHYNPENGTFTITSVKMLRQFEGDKKFGPGTDFKDIPNQTPETVMNLINKIPGAEKTIRGFFNLLAMGAGDDFKAKYTGTEVDRSDNKKLGAKLFGSKATNEQIVNVMMEQFPKSTAAISNFIIEGSASNAVLLRQALISAGVPKSQAEKEGGGYGGYTYSQETFTGSELPAKVRQAIINKYATQDSAWSSIKAELFLVGNNKKLLSESRKKHILREIKKPTTLPEAKKKFKVKPKVLGHPSNKTLSDQMKDTTPNVAFKKELPVWSMNQKMRNARSSQAKKNEVLEYLGSSGDHWDYMTKTIKEHNKKIINLNYGGEKKKVTRKEQVDKDILVFMEDDLGNKSSVLQSKINEMQAEAGDKEMFAKYYEMNPQKKSLFKEVVKRGVFDYKGKPSKKGYPDKEPAQLDPKTGMHPEYGKKYKHDKLDPHSAESMPMQGDPEIDANISKNVDPEKKKRKSRILSQPNG